jgi:hypothetical protein
MEASRLEYSFMVSSAQIELWAAERVAAAASIETSGNGVRSALWGETRLPEKDYAKLVGAVPVALSEALKSRAYYFVPLVIAEQTADQSAGQTAEPLETQIAPGYTVEFSDRAICHRNVSIGATEAVFISTRLVEDRFGLAFEFFINVAHNFVEVAGVPESFSTLAWTQAQADVRGETSQDAWEARKAALEVHTGQVDERARNAYNEAAFSDALAIYILSLYVDFDYHDLRERDYPLLAPAALAERLRLVANLFPANAGYEFQVLYRRRG